MSCLNHHLWGYLAKRRSPVEFTRSRPYHKDDNAHVEQKNWMWPRQLLGYTRLEDMATRRDCDRSAIGSQSPRSLSY
jgi:hypothetical protein